MFEQYRKKIFKWLFYLVLCRVIGATALRGVNVERCLQRSWNPSPSVSTESIFNLLYHVSPLAILFLCLLGRDISGRSRVALEAGERFRLTPTVDVFCVWCVCEVRWSPRLLLTCSRGWNVLFPFIRLGGPRCYQSAFTTSVFVVWDWIQMAVWNTRADLARASHMANSKEIFKGACTRVSL